MKRKLAIVGAHGLPAKYGGYCTLAEYLAEYKPKDFDVTVYCCKPEYQEHPDSYKGVHLEWIDRPARGLQAFRYHAYGIKHAIKAGADCILLCGPNGGFSLPFYPKHRDKFYMNVGGVEWKRNKYNFILRNVMRLLMKLGVKSSAHLIADNIGMQEYYKEEYGRKSTMIAYGGDQAQKTEITPEGLKMYTFLNKPFAVAIARIQRDNNTEMLLEAFKDAKIPLVYIGNWNVTPWAKATREKYSVYPNLIMLDAIFDIPLLNQIRSNCALYVHGHSAGGTNPSLVEAMHLGVPLACYDNGFNNNATYNKAFYFKSAEQLADIVANTPEVKMQEVARTMKQLALEHYRWETIAEQYYANFRNDPNKQ